MADKAAAVWAVLDKYRDTPFEWGAHDCCLFAARCLDAQHGTDYAKALAAIYTDRREAHRFIRLHAGLRNAVSSILGPMAEGLPRRGDVTLVDTEEGDGVGVCVGFTIAVAAETGFEFYPLAMAKGHWRVESR